MTTKTNYTLLTIEIKSTYIFTIVDLLLRALLFLLYDLSYFNVWIFAGSQVVLLLIEVIGFAWFSPELTEKNKPTLNQKYDGKIDKTDIDIQTPDNVLTFFAIAGLISSFFVLKNIFHPSEWYAYVFILIACVIFSVIFIFMTIMTAYPKGFNIVGYSVNSVTETGTSKTTADITSQFPDLITVPIAKEVDNMIQVDQYDENDSKIAKLESSLKDINSRVDAYMLESVLLGALAFSGFLTIIASNILTTASALYNTVSVDITSIIKSIFAPHSSVNTNIEHLLQRESLFLLIMFQSLLCSFFFILVLALRLRYSNLSLKLDYLIRIMNIFNAKEEELINIKLQSEQANKKLDDRQARISGKIDVAISDATKLLKEIRPIVRLMSMFRNIGIIFFFLILATSGLFFSQTISLLILGLALATVVYRFTDARLKLQKIKALLIRH